ncbi:J domain-containing protein [Candidatus Uhrbacteria bacterium]|nr:J domain-containing protein [Candidatus Uhrbacteria bacterium]
MVYTVTPLTLEGFVEAHKGVVLRVTLGTDTSFPSVISDHFEMEYRGVIVYGTMRWEDMPVPAWRDKHFGGLHGLEIVRGGIPGQPGFYLFLGGNLWHYEPEADLGSAVHQAMFKLHLEWKTQGLRPPRRPSWEHAVIAGIEKYMSMSMVAASVKVAAKMAPKPQPSAQRPPLPPPGAAAPPKPAKEDPYAVLGVPKGSTKGVVDKVFRVKASAFHPDKVNDLPADVRAMFEADFKRLTGAKDDIYKAQRWE